MEMEKNLNGQVATVDDGIDYEQYENDKKLNVRLRDETVKKVKITKLKARCRLWNVDVASSTEYLGWRKEQECIFVAEDGFQHTYFLHLPVGFSKAWKEKESETQHSASPSPPKPWPLLLFLHGTGGSSFLTHRKKRLHSVGLEHAASNFIIVSPKCEWTWKQTPSVWVQQLVRALRAASYVDPERIYVSGCSMGGMGTLEVGAAMPDVVAAIAPIAAHHSIDRREILAEGLKSMPMLAVQSADDATCPLVAQEELWNKMCALGNSKLQVFCAPSIDHCSMLEKAYCDDVIIFEWLLRHTRPAQLR